MLPSDSKNLQNSCWWCLLDEIRTFFDENPDCEFLLPRFARQEQKLFRLGGQKRRGLGGSLPAGRQGIFARPRFRRFFFRRRNFSCQQSWRATSVILPYSVQFDPVCLAIFVFELLYQQCFLLCIEFPLLYHRLALRYCLIYMPKYRQKMQAIQQ